MQGVREEELQATIAESMKRGHARILDGSFVPGQQELVDAVRLAQQGAEHAKHVVTYGMAQLVYRLSVNYMRRWLPYLPSHASFDDVFGAGLVGLQRAVRDFDPDRGYAFTTYAGWWIRNGVQAQVYDLAGSGAIKEKRFTKGLAPTDQLAGGNVDSLERTVGEDRELHELVEAPEALELEQVGRIVDVLATVDPLLPAIVDLVDRNHAYREVARIVGIPEHRVRSLLEAAQVAARAAGY